MVPLEILAASLYINLFLLILSIIVLHFLCFLSSFFFIVIFTMLHFLAL